MSVSAGAKLQMMSMMASADGSLQDCADRPVRGMADRSVQKMADGAAVQHHTLFDGFKSESTVEYFGSSCVETCVSFSRT